LLGISSFGEVENGNLRLRMKMQRMLHIVWRWFYHKNNGSLITGTFDKSIVGNNGNDASNEVTVLKTWEGMISQVQVFISVIKLG